MMMTMMMKENELNVNELTTTKAFTTIIIVIKTITFNKQRIESGWRETDYFKSVW